MSIDCAGALARQDAPDKKGALNFSTGALLYAGRSMPAGLAFAPILTALVLPPI